MKKELTNGSVLSNIIFFSLPYLLSYFLQTLYGMADLFIAGQFNGADVITAVSVGSQVMHMLTVIIVGLAMGSTVMISQSVGARNYGRVSKTIGNTVTLFITVSVTLTAILLIFAGDIVTLMSTPSEAVSQTKIYLMICFAGIPFITAYNILSAVLRGMGDSKSPMYFIAVACVLNIIIDYVFIGAFNMGAAGAAFGTVISQMVSVIIAMIFLFKAKTGIHITKSDFAFDKALMKDILKVGLPVACQDGFIQVSFILITVIANQRGVTIAAAVGIVEKIISFLFLVPSSMLSAISAIAAQNVGAGLHTRAVKTLKYGIIIAITFGAAVTVICEFAASPIIGCFTDEAEVIVMGARYLKAYVIDCIVAGIHFCFSGYFCAYGMSIVSFIHNLTSIVLIRIPGAYFASVYYPDDLFPMGLAAPLGSLLSAVMCIAIYLLLRKKYFTAKQI